MRILARLMPAERIPNWLKAAQLAALALAVCFTVGADTPSGRLYSLDHQLMCTCGCAEILGECNHVGCTESSQELAELRAGIAAGQSDQQIFSAFTAKYGATVLAAPTAHGFDLVAWIAPFAVLAAALLGTVLLVRRWSVGNSTAPALADPLNADPAERERLEKIRRETGSDGGF
jgi:cytochrome c-type biogenesis protein CcmH